MYYKIQAHVLYEHTDNWYDWADGQRFENKDAAYEGLIILLMQRMLTGSKVHDQFRIVSVTEEQIYSTWKL